MPSTTARKAIGSLVLGVYDGDALRSRRPRRDRLHRCRRRDSFAGSSRCASPESVRRAAQRRGGAASALCPARTRGGNRVSRLDGGRIACGMRPSTALREDKPAREVVRETPIDNGTPPEAQAERESTLTHPDRLYWPDVGVTKEGLADYYAEVWPRMAPFIVGRALALVRCPDGMADRSSSRSTPGRGSDPQIALVEDPEETGEPLISIRDLDGLIALVQVGRARNPPVGLDGRRLGAART